MSQRHGAAALNLLLKNRHHATSAAQDVSETHTTKQRFLATAMLLHNHLADSLRSPHYRSRIHRLICRYLHEAGNSHRERLLYQIARAGDIVGNGFAGIGFHQVNVFMGRCVKNHVRAKPL